MLVVQWEHKKNSNMLLTFDAVLTIILMKTGIIQMSSKKVTYAEDMSLFFWGNQDKRDENGLSLHSTQNEGRSKWPIIGWSKRDKTHRGNEDGKHIQKPQN